MSFMFFGSLKISFEVGVSSALKGVSLDSAKWLRNLFLQNKRPKIVISRYTKMEKNVTATTQINMNILFPIPRGNP